MNGYVFFLALMGYPIASMAQYPERYSVIIHEVMADPSPAVGLPAAEFIELRNRSSQPVELKDWSIGDGNSRAVITVSIQLPPDSLLILCPSSVVNQYKIYGRAVGLNGFPSLNNDGDLLILSAPDGRVVHAIQYELSWYKNEVKAQGGWSLEMMDPEQPCAGAANWKASLAQGGGSPGMKNSIQAVLTDSVGPVLMQAVATDSLSLLLSFDEPVDSASASEGRRYHLQPDTEILWAAALPPLFQQVQLRLNSALQPQQVYELTVINTRDCAGHASASPQSLKAGLADSATAQSVVINELLFNPKPGGCDYVELFNRSKRIIDLRQLYLANRSSAGGLSNMKRLADEPACLFPGEYRVFTEDPATVQRQYTLSGPRVLQRTSGLPSMPDDQGHLILLSAGGTAVDEVAYEHRWHFGLLDDEEGVALERIDPGGPSQQPNNWASASSVSGYGTPGRVNSQFHSLTAGKAGVKIAPKIFSPDNDGFEDRAGIHYELDLPGYLLQISLFDKDGYPVNSLMPLATLDQRGVVWWDGLDRNRQPLPSGVYILQGALIHPSGRIHRFRESISLARRR